jgi:hypothetical protein
MAKPPTTAMTLQMVSTMAVPPAGLEPASRGVKVRRSNR